MSATPGEVAAGRGRTTGPVRLRDVERGDLPRMYRMQTDPDSNSMAVTIPRTATEFDAHWTTALQEPTVTAKAILLGDEVVGYVCRFRRDDRQEVGYWIDREHWGKGIATRALRLFLGGVTARPLHALVATSNGASSRVLRKCGFAVERVQLMPACDRFPACAVAILVALPELDGA